VKVAETIEQAGRRVGGHAWVAARLFEMTGRWSTSVDDPRARAWLGAASRRYGWHAELWHGLLPAVPHLAVDELVSPPDVLAPLLAELDGLDGLAGAEDADRAGSDAPVDGRTARLADLTDRVLEAAIDELEQHRDVTTPISDGPTLRVLSLVLADMPADLQSISSMSPPRSGR
jgi:hypothetical protein